MEFLIDCFEELDGTWAVFTETWLANGSALDEDIRELANGAGLGMICLNREPNVRGIAHEGVAVIHSTSA